MHKYNVGDFVLFRDQRSADILGQVSRITAITTSKGTRIHYYLTGKGDYKVFEWDIRTSITPVELTKNKAYIRNELDDPELATEDETEE